jgi:hypothetical protein
VESVLVAKLLAALVWGVVVGLLAKRKNRNPWGWGIAGTFSWLIALVILTFLPYKCPKCERSITNDQGKNKICPRCGSFAAASRVTEEVQAMQRVQPFREQPDAATIERFWSMALAEFESESRRPGLWARLFAEAGGNETSAKAAYLKARVAELENEPPAFISELRSKGYKVELVASRWAMTNPNGGVSP